MHNWTAVRFLHPFKGSSTLCQVSQERAPSTVCYPSLYNNTLKFRNSWNHYSNKNTIIISCPFKITKQQQRKYVSEKTHCAQALSWTKGLLATSYQFNFTVGHKAFRLMSRIYSLQKQSVFSTSPHYSRVNSRFILPWIAHITMQSISI